MMVPLCWQAADITVDRGHGAVDRGHGANDAGIVAGVQCRHLICFHTGIVG